MHGSIGRLGAWLALLAACSSPSPGACVPDPAATTPTPVARWDRAHRCSRTGDDPAWSIDCDVEAYRVHARLAGTLAAFEPAGEVRCRVDRRTGRQTCPSTVPIQRFTDEENEALEWCVTSVGHDGVESACSNVIAVCMPEIWDGPPHPYE